MPRLVDMHCHLDRIKDAGDVAQTAAQAGIAFLDVTVSPRDAERARALFAHAPNVRVGCGLHPWWIHRGDCGKHAIEQLANDARHTAFVGEIGLDFSTRYESSRQMQLQALEAVLDAIAASPLPRRVVSLHAVRSAGAVLDLLERYELVGGSRAADGMACVFHWFSGTSDELTRARKLGCYFSVSEHMLKSKRGREYARIIPKNRLLTETDAPPRFDEPYELCDLTRSLDTCISRVAELRGTSPEHIRAVTAENGSKLLGLAEPLG